MQTKEQIKNWKVVASVATVAALGVSGLAIASPGDRSGTPAPIDVQDQRSTDATFLTTTTLGFEVVPTPSFSHLDSVNSPSPSLDTPLSVDSPVSVAPRASVDSPASVDPPRPAPAPAPAPDSPSPDSPSPDSPDSPSSVDS